MSNLVIALQITALGMGLVFGAIVLLWGMMALLTSLAADQETTASDGAGAASARERERKAQAAAIAVTTAMAEHQLSQTHPLSLPPTAIVSAWQLGLRSRQLYQKGVPITRNPRKVG